MANKLSFSIQVEGAEKTAQQIAAVNKQLDALGTARGKTSQPVSQFLAGLPPHIQQDVLRQLGFHPGVASGPAPIPLSGGGSGGGVNWRQAAFGLAAAPFSPWVGARALGSSGLFGGAGGVGGGSLMFGSGGFGGFLAAFTALQVVSHSLRFAFEQLKDSVRRGNELYVKSAGLGLQPALLAHLQNTLSVAGLPSDTAERLLAQAQFTRGIRISPKEIQGQATLGAGRGILSKEEMQTILNLSTDIADAWNKTAQSALLSAELSKSLHESNAVWQRFKADWNTVWEGFSAAFMKRIGEPLLKAGDWILKLQNAQNKFVLESLGIATKGVGADFKKFGLGPGTLAGRPESGWEKMGLIISGGIGGTDYARQTAANTKRIADVLTGKFSPTTPYEQMMTGQVFHLP